MADRKLFDRTLVTSPVGTKRLAIGDPSNLADNITLDSFKSWLGLSGTKTLAVPIGPWNMNTTQVSPMISLSFPMQPGQIFPTFPDIDKIYGIRVIIRSDLGGLSDFLSVQNGTAATSPQVSIGKLTFIYTSVFVLLTRRAGSYYATQADFKNTLVSRGWVIIDYSD